LVASRSRMDVARPDRLADGDELGRRDIDGIQVGGSPTQSAGRRRKRDAHGVIVEIRQFEYFSAVVREGSLTRAAQAGHISQSALSKQMRSLERELGIDLLIRVPEGVRPTEAGRRLAAMCEEVLSYIEQMVPRVRAVSNELVGTVTVGLSPSLFPVLAEHLQTTFRTQHPGLRLQLVEALPMFSTEWLETGRLDVGIFRRWPSLHESPRLNFVDIGSDDVVLVGTPGMLARHVGDLVTAQDLPSLPLALTPGFRQIMCTRLDVTGQPARLGTEIDSIHMVKALVVRGGFCAPLPLNFVRDEIAAGLLESRSFEPSVHSHVVSVTRAGRPAPAAVDAVTQVCRLHLERPDPPISIKRFTN
jgi:LysR family nitrogen assimilation transcriptional regulator